MEEGQNAQFLFNGQAVSVSSNRRMEEQFNRQISESAMYSEEDDLANSDAGAEDRIPPLPPAPSSSSSPMRSQKSILSMLNDTGVVQQGDDVNELWDEIEGFLNRPPPSIQNSNRASGPVIPASQMSLPKLMKERSKLRRNQHAPPPMPPKSGANSETGAGYVNSIRSKVKSGSNLKRTNNTIYSTPQKNNLDMSKVEEAMAYVDRLKEGNVQSALAGGGIFDLSGPSNDLSGRKGGGVEQGRKNRSQKPNKNGGDKRPSGSKSAPKKKNASNTRSCYGSGTGGGTGRGSGRGRGGKKNRSMNGKGAFDLSGQQAPESQAQALDYESLALNFEQGIGLRKLQEELEASKQSMAQSRGAIQHAAQQWFQK